MALRRRSSKNQTTSQHLAAAFEILREEIRRAGLGHPPTAAECDLLADISAHMARLALDESLDPSLREALLGVSRTADWLREPPGSGSQIIDVGGL